MNEESLSAALEPALPPLVFVLGAHRSGTTFLHQVLADTGHYSFVQPYDLIHFDHLLEFAAAGRAEAERAALDVELRSGQANRGLDDLAVGASVAEEYGHMLPKEGEFSFFSPSLTDASRPRFELLCRKKRALDGHRPLVLKNPDDFYSNFMRLHEWYPEARMVFLHRHPLAVLNSHMKAWSRLLEERNLYFSRLHAHYRHLLENERELAFFRQVMKSKAGAGAALGKLSDAYRFYLENVERLPESRYLSLRYEDVCAEPDRHLAAISQFLGQPAPAVSLREAINTRPLRLLPSVEAAYEAGAAGLSEYLQRFGYERMPAF
ncbi:hypothetical protein ABS71_10545 [bacterium SCN 62-11]|nr:MAG: hypothetical protein ABS71_10545 [bacterium SCN 62-11]